MEGQSTFAGNQHIGRRGFFPGHGQPTVGRFGSGVFRGAISEYNSTTAARGHHVASAAAPQRAECRALAAMRRVGIKAPGGSRWRTESGIYRLIGACRRAAASIWKAAPIATISDTTN